MKNLSKILMLTLFIFMSGLCVTAQSSVQFSSATASVTEGVLNINLTIDIENENAEATTVNVALTGGDAADVDGYDIEMVEFAANSAISQEVILTITDDDLVEGDEEFTFTLQDPMSVGGAVVGAQGTITVTIVDNDIYNGLVVNEYIPQPAGGGTGFDANGDGEFNGSTDEYIELVNSGGGDLDISDWEIRDSQLRHTFPLNTVIPAGGAIVVFGGGTPSGGFGNSIVQTASGSLGMLNSGDALTIRDDGGVTRLSFSYGAEPAPTPAPAKTVALVRDPDTPGEPFIDHPVLAAYFDNSNDPVQASPGLKTDGSLFIPGGDTEVRFSSATVSVTEDGASIDLTIEIVNQDLINDTEVDVVFTGMDNTGINGFISEHVIFPAISAANETVNIIITQNIDAEAAKTFTFELQGVSGGNGNAGIDATRATTEIVIVDDEITISGLVINEVHADPHGTNGDANGDGDRDAADDEFIELVNNGLSELDVGGYEIFDNPSNFIVRSRHVFPDGTVIPAKGAIVVFGGGTPTGTFGNSEVQTASTGNLSATNEGDTFIVQDAADNTLIYFTYDDAGDDNGDNNQSITRDPDFTGPMVQHTAAAGSLTSLFSPGTKFDGSPFLTEVQFTSATASVTEDVVEIELTIAIINEDANEATTVEVALTGGTGTEDDIENYTFQTVTFEPMDAGNQTVTFQIEDDMTPEAVETLIFTLENVGGGIDDFAVIGAQNTTEIVIFDNDITASGLIINEVNADPDLDEVAGDANGDGDRDTSDDEFIEFVNTGANPLDVGGYEIFDTNSAITSRHVFPENTIIPAGGAIVVFGGGALDNFGGGNPDAFFGNSIVQVANGATNDLAITNSDETLIVQDADGHTLIYFTYGAEGGDDQSITRSPDITGTDTPMTKHSEILASGESLFSPGTKVDGTYFIPVTQVQFSSASASVDEAGVEIELTIEIADVDAINPTTVNVVLTDDGNNNAADVTYEASVIFPAGSEGDQVVILTIIDDDIVEGDQELEFTLQGVAGGDDAQNGLQDTFTLTIVDNDYDPPTALVVNEYMPWSAKSDSEATEFDANGDGTLGGLSDEYVELVNSGEVDLDISGWKIDDGGEEPRHIFPALTVIPAGGAIVVFGGDDDLDPDLDAFGYSFVQTASESSSLGMTNGGDKMMIRDDTDAPRLSFFYNAATRAVAFARSPDIEGGFIKHQAIGAYTNKDGTDAQASPGLKIDGTLFIPPVTQVYFSSATASVNEGAVTYDIVVRIIGEDVDNDTAVEVALTGAGSGSNTDDIETYTTQQVTFPAGSAEDQEVALTIIDDLDIEGDEDLVFILKNVTGGNTARIGIKNTMTVTIVDNDLKLTDLVVNEFMPWPAGSDTAANGATEFDANGDGDPDNSEDEYIEFVNSGSEDLDISGWKINDGIDRHIFYPNTVVRAGAAIVVFGGGVPVGDFGYSIVQTASEDGSSIGLLNTGDEIFIMDALGETKISFIYGQATRAVAFSRSPDITGSIIEHSPLAVYINEDDLAAQASPGLRSDGSLFIPVGTQVQFSSATTSVNEADAGTYELTVTIIDEDENNETTADVVLATEGAESDFSYTTQTVTFPAGSRDAQTISVTVTDDDDLEGDELFTFAIVNVTGGDKAQAGIRSTADFFVLDDDVPLIFNEIHADPSGDLSGDANNDGVRDASADEFIEVINQSAEVVDISGWEYHDENSKRHVFSDGTVLEPGRAVVVFGGGIPTGQFGGSDVQLASEDTGVSLLNTGEALKILDNTGALVGGTIYNRDANNNQSITRSPDITGTYTIHTEATGSLGALYSPGTRVNGDLFINIVLGVSEQLVSKVILYPNPASDELNIRLDEKLTDFQLILHGVNGGEAVSHQFYDTDVMNVDVSNFPKGMYIYTIKSAVDGVNQTGKLLIK